MGAILARARPHSPHRIARVLASLLGAPQRARLSPRAPTPSSTKSCATISSARSSATSRAACRRADARDAARRAFGNVTVATEQARDAMRWRWLEELRQDVAYALRTFRRAPRSSLTVVATIGLGLGLLVERRSRSSTRTCCVRSPCAIRTRCTRSSWTSRDGREAPFTWPQFSGSRGATSDARSPTRSAFAIRSDARFAARRRSASSSPATISRCSAFRRRSDERCSPSDAAAPGGGAVDRARAIARGTRRSAATPSVIGRRDRINGVRCTVVGVAREGFGGLERACRSISGFRSR